MQLTSSSFSHNQPIPDKYGCDGEDINPPLEISEVPENAESLVLIMDDPDAPITGSFVHWTLWNIDPATDEIPENSVPEGAVQGTTNFGSVGYGGPCPPSGEHRYFFRLFALDKKLDLAEGASREELDQAMEGSVIDSTELIGLFSRD